MFHPFVNFIFLMSFIMTVQSEPLQIETKPVFDQSNNIRQYLMRAASEITHNSLADINTRDDWERVREQRYQELTEMLSLHDVPLSGERPPLNIKETGVIQKDNYKIIKLYYESLPNLYVPANLYVPNTINHKAPAILYPCGHSRTQKVSYQPHPRKFAELGFVALVFETVQWGEVYGSHWGCYAEGQFQWYSRGYTPGGVELWNGIRGIDLLCSLDYVDPNNIGVTGISGGGSQSWYIGAIDRRVKAVAPVCGCCTLESHIRQRMVDGHCDCMTPINTKLIDYHDIGALIAPRPLLIGQADRDGLNSIEGVKQSVAYMKKIYELYGAEDNINLVVTPGGHSYHEKSRTQIFSFMMKHLMDKDVSPNEVGDVDQSEDSLLSEDELRVYVDGPPANDRTKTIQETFVKVATPPALKTVEDWNKHKSHVIEFLKDNTFNAFPKLPGDLSLRMEYRSRSNETSGMNDYTFVPEKGFRLTFEWNWKETETKKKPVLLVLRNPNEKRWASESFSNELRPEWTRAYLQVRGVGETSWSQGLQWHVRRASAWTGRTIASMRVYDVLRCIEALRSLDEVDPDKIAIAARGEMAAVAMYAALLDGRLESVYLQNPPATQNAPGETDGTGPAIEMLNCLRVTDLPQVVGFLYPTKVQLMGAVDENYDWSINLANQLGWKDAIQKR